MNEIVVLILAFVVGLVLGTLFFGGLWWTVKKSVASSKPSLWVFGSFVVRLGLTLLIFYFISQYGWQAMLTSLFGFIVARFVVMRVTKIYDGKEQNLEKEVKHEA